MTVSHNIDFVSIAASVGYEHAVYLHDLDELENYISNWKKDKGLAFLYLRIAKGSIDNLGRPKTKPFEVKERLMKFLEVGKNA